MKKTIVAIFAHPDDESFGPGGTLYKLAKKHSVYVICVTNGDGKMGDRRKEIALGKVRRKELSDSAKILGIKKVFFLGYRDGSLNHNMYHAIADKIQPILQKLLPNQLITFEPRGISGHTDHVVISNITSFLFHKNSFIKTLWYYCQHERSRETKEHDYFIYMPPGYKNKEIDEVINISDVWEIKMKAMYAHKSQRKDAEGILERGKLLPKEECFLVINK